MRARRSWSGILGTLALAGLSASTGAQPVGEEFQVNTYTTGSQAVGHDDSIAVDASGNFVVVWNSYGQDGSSFGIFGQRYDAAGVAKGDEFQVNSYTTGFQYHSSVASDASGNFVVAWTSQEQDGGGYEISGQRFDSGGVAQGEEFRVNSYTPNDQRYPSVASDANGNFVVVWDSYRGNQDGSGSGVFGQRYDAAGVALGDEFQVNSYTTGDQGLPSVASDASGNFVVAWQSNHQDGDQYGIFGQRYDGGGVAQGPEFRVNSSTPGFQRFSSVASYPNGDFVVVWSTHGQSPSRIDGQRYDSGGAAQGDEFRVNTNTTIGANAPSVASDASGNFIVVWHGEGPASGDDIFGRRYDAGGVAQGEAFRMTHRRRDQSKPSLVATGNNQFVVVWQSGDDQDGSGTGVFGQRLAFGGGDTITVVSPNTNVKWRMGSLHDIQWTHNLGLGATFRIELDRDDDGDYEELVADDVAVDSATRGSFAWTATGPPSATARMRLSWTDDPSVFDASDVTFQIRPPGLTVTERPLAR